MVTRGTIVTVWWAVTEGPTPHFRLNVTPRSVDSWSITIDLISESIVASYTEMLWKLIFSARGCMAPRYRKKCRISGFVAKCMDFWLIINSSEHPGSAHDSHYNGPENSETEKITYIQTQLITYCLSTSKHWHIYSQLITYCLSTSWWSLASGSTGVTMGLRQTYVLHNTQCSTFR